MVSRTKIWRGQVKKPTSLWMLDCLILLWLPSRLILKLPSRFIWAIEKPSYNSFQLRCHLKALQSTHNPNSSKEDSSLSALAIAELRPEEWMRILLVSNIFSLASIFNYLLFDINKTLILSLWHENRFMMDCCDKTEFVVSF